MPNGEDRDGEVPRLELAVSRRPRCARRRGSTLTSRRAAQVQGGPTYGQARAAHEDPTQAEVLNLRQDERCPW